MEPAKAASLISVCRALPVPRARIAAGAAPR